MPHALADDDATLASERVLEGVVALGKAELRLAVSELRAWVEKTLVAAALLWLAACVTQVAIALICVSPLLLAVWSPPVVLVSIGLSVVVGGTLGALGLSRMRAAFRGSPRVKPDRESMAATETFDSGGSANAE